MLHRQKERLGGSCCEVFDAGSGKCCQDPSVEGEGANLEAPRVMRIPRMRRIGMDRAIWSWRVNVRHRRHPRKR